MADCTQVSYVRGGATPGEVDEPHPVRSRTYRRVGAARATDDEKALFREQLSAILDYAAILQKLDTSAIPPTATVLPLRNVMRDDVVQPSMPVEDVLANAPAAEDDCFRVTAILDVTPS